MQILLIGYSRFVLASFRGKVLITSRASNLDQFEIQEPLVLDVLSSGESVNLLLSRTHYDRDSENLAAAIELTNY